MSSGYFAEPRTDIQALVDAPGRRILDVGCGSGVLGAALKRSGAAFVAGIEVVPAVAAEARGNLDQLVQGSALEAALPFTEGEFDYVIFADVLEHTADPGAVLGRMLPYLARDGRVIVSVPNMRFYVVLARLIANRWSYTDSGIRDRTHLRIFTRRSLETMLRERGLVIERLERNYRLFEDQAQIGRGGALATRIAVHTIAPLLFRDLMAFQYRAVARRGR